MWALELWKYNWWLWFSLAWLIWSVKFDDDRDENADNVEEMLGWFFLKLYLLKACVLLNVKPWTDEDDVDEDDEGSTLKSCWFSFIVRGEDEDEDEEDENKDEAKLLKAPWCWFCWACMFSLCGNRKFDGNMLPYKAKAVAAAAALREAAPADHCGAGQGGVHQGVQEHPHQEHCWWCGITATDMAGYCW